MHGLIALTAAFAVFHLAVDEPAWQGDQRFRLRWGAFPILLSRGLIYAFSQMRDVVTAVLMTSPRFSTARCCTTARGRRRPMGHHCPATGHDLSGIFRQLGCPATLFIFWLISHRRRICRRPRSDGSAFRFLACCCCRSRPFRFSSPQRFLVPGATSISDNKSPDPQRSPAVEP